MGQSSAWGVFGIHHARNPGGFLTWDPFLRGLNLIFKVTLQWKVEWKAVFCSRPLSQDTQGKSIHEDLGTA